MINYKILGQVAPSSASLVPLYTVPASKEAVISTIAVCNRGTASATFRLAAISGGGSITNQNYLVYNSAVNIEDTLFLQIGATLNATDTLNVYASSASFSFTAFGSELS